MAKRIFVAVVRDGVIEGDFALVADVDPLGDVDALKQRIKASRSRLRDVELGDMTVFGAWATASEVPEDTTEATKGRRCDPAATLGDLIGGMERAYFLARITAPSSAAAGGSGAPGAGADSRDETATLAAIAGLTTRMVADSAGLAARMVADSAGLATRLEAGSARLTTLMESLVVQVHAPNVAFSRVSSKIATQAMISLAIGVGGQLQLPDLEEFMPDPVTLDPHPWLETLETLASRALLPLLRTWVVTGAPQPIRNIFLDVQPFASHTPIQLHVDGVAHFAGVPDMVIVGARIQREEEAVPITGSAVVAVDWMTQPAFGNKSQIAAIGRVQALAFASSREFRIGQPVFMTDMSTGFRCWIVINQSLYYLHPDDRDLSLAEGVALIRLFLMRAAAGDVVSADFEDGRAVLVFGRRSGNSITEMLPMHAAPGSSVGGAPATTPTPGSGGKFGGHGSGYHSSSGLISHDVSPDSDGSESDVDFETVVMSYAAVLAEGGGFPLSSFHEAMPAVDDTEAT